MDDHVQVETGPLDVFAQPTLAVGLIDGPLQPLGRLEVLAPNVDIGLMTADGKGRDDHAFEQCVWIPLHDVAVLERTGLALVRVDHEVLWLGRFLGDEGPLPAGGKPGPTQSAQISFGDLVDHLFRGHGGERFPGRAISVVSNVILVPGPVGIFQSRGEHRPVGADERIGFRGRGGATRFRECILNDRVDSFTLKRPDKTFVDLGHGRHFTGAQALDLGESDFLTRRGFARLDLQAILDLLQQVSGPAQHAWQARANPKFAPAHWFGVEHVVERDCFTHVRTCHTQGLSHPSFCLLGDVTLILLDEPQQRQHGCSRLLVKLQNFLGPGV